HAWKPFASKTITVEAPDARTAKAEAVSQMRAVGNYAFVKTFPIRAKKNPARKRMARDEFARLMHSYQQAADQAYRGYRLQYNDLAQVWNVSKGGHHIWQGSTLAGAKKAVDSILGLQSNPMRGEVDTAYAREIF